eukprot:480519-Rhodomonas_salina.1
MTQIKGPLRVEGRESRVEGRGARFQGGFRVGFRVSGQGSLVDGRRSRFQGRVEIRGSSKGSRVEGLLKRV